MSILPRHNPFMEAGELLKHASRCLKESGLN